MDPSALDPKRPNDLLAREASRANVPMVDASACLAARTSPALLYYRQDSHFTAAGHAALSDCVADALVAFLGMSR
jgi:hypothetical protein